MMADHAVPAVPAHGGSVDTVRAEIVSSIASALRQAAPGLPAGAAELITPLFAAIPTAELAERPIDALAAAAASLWSLAQRRPPGAALVRVTPAGASGTARAVAEIVTDDMPYLVDSALAAVGRGGRMVTQLLHPVLPASRDPAGQILGAGTGPLESWMRIEFGVSARGPTGDDAALEALLRRTMDDVRAAASDSAAMMALMQRAEAEVVGAADPGPAADFLRWLADDNFVLLGHRRVVVDAAGGLSIATEENLGLLRNPEIAVFDALTELVSVQHAVRAAFLEPTALVVAKANLRSTVHRAQHGDVVVTRAFRPDGAVSSVRLFYGLFAATAYTRNPRAIPLLAPKVEAILAASGIEPRSHDGRALRQVLDTWPRDELFQAPAEAILAGARRVLDLRLRPRAALVLRLDPFERFVSAIVWLPRDSFATQLRERVGQMLARAYAGHIAAFYTAVGDEPLARINYIVSTIPGQVPAVDVTVLEGAIRQAARDFVDRLNESLTDQGGEAAAATLLARWGDAFPAAYREAATPAQAAADVRLAERAAASGRIAVRLEHRPGEPADQLTMRIAQPGSPMALADTLPLLESLDLRALQEVPFDLTPAGLPAMGLQVFSLHTGAPVDPSRFPALLEAFDALLDARAEADGFNRLVLRAGLIWRECWLLRAMYRWLKQVGFAFSQASVEAALATHPGAARILVDFFHMRFDPNRASRDEGALDAAWAALLDGVANPDEDRILARLMTLLRAVLRTNYYQDKPYLALKIDSAGAGDMPLPRPWREVFVHSARMEGCHLRAGPVARGGIRWSDRREDFRTEILGLMKAQRLKNVVIVPTGAKGGFVLKQAPAASDRSAFLAEGQACYRLLINAMLDMADDLRGAAVMTPDRVVRRDGDDPYMVAAADKGTATFSDLANSIAVERHFWLDDAFASGGSQGYDHKAMGITARGAWVMIARHFAELGLDIQAEPFTCVGVGDMSGDVFGNGLLVSRHTRLLAAFDHRHIFIDPEPGPDAYDERARLFAQGPSSWADYDRSVISMGGGVFSRAEKRIVLPGPAAALLGLTTAPTEPALVIQAILRAPADLLYFGGIGTYVKATAESQADAGDRANDALRVNGAELRARVLGEGANLAITQAGRIEYAKTGGRLNTDALDNSAGVSTSDREVNIKILLADAIQDGALTRRQRDDLLVSMTEEVGHLVLRDNHEQSLAVSLEMLDAAQDLASHAALMTRLEREGVLDRAVSGLPDRAALQTRASANEGLLRPEVAALLPVAKLWLTDAVESSDLADDPAFEPTLRAYFPTALQKDFLPFALRHRLRRELIATAIVNTVVNRLGPAALLRLAADASPLAVARAGWLAGALFGVEPLCAAIDQAAAPAPARLRALLAVRRLHETATRDLLDMADGGGASLDEAIRRFRPGIAAMAERAAADAAGTPAAAGLREAGLPDEVAALVAAIPFLSAAPAVVRLAQEIGLPPGEASVAWHRVGQSTGIDDLRTATAAAAAPGSFGARAKSALMEDLMAAQTRLTRMALRGMEPAALPGAAPALLVAREAAAAADLAGLTVATRAICALS